MKQFLFPSLILLSSYILIVSCASTANTSYPNIISEPEIIPLNPSETLTLQIQPLNNTLTFQDIDPSADDSLSRIFTEYYQNQKPNGITCTVYSPTKGIWEKQYGFCDANKAIPVTGNTKMPIGSISKIFTAMIVASLVQEGRLSYSDTVDKWFPEYDFLKKVTIDHLLRHTSGIITSELVLSNYQKNNEYISDVDIVKNTMEAYPSLLFEPGKYYHYSNTGYIMLGIISEKVSGKKMSDLFNEEIIIPLDLKSTAYSTIFLQPDFSNISFNSEGIPYINTENPANPHAAGCIVSTPNDSIKMLAAILNGTIMKKIDYLCLLDDMNKIYSSLICDVYYGRGISLIKIKVPGKEANYIGHKGGFSYFSSLLFYNQNNNTFCSIVSNQSVQSLDPLMFGLLEYFQKNK